MTKPELKKEIENFKKRREKVMGRGRDNVTVRARVRDRIRVMAKSGLKKEIKNFKNRREKV
jgi:hypothetical protein